MIRALSSDPAQLLAQLDEVWDRPSAAVLAGIEAATKSNDALIRQAAVEALGRLGQAVDPSLLGIRARWFSEQRPGRFDSRTGQSRMSP